MKAKFCLPIVKSSMKEVVKEIQKNQDNFAMLEVWVDYLTDDFSVILEGIKNLSKKLKDRLIIVFRQKNGKKIHMSFKYRMNIIEVTESTKTYVDIDMEKQKQDIEEIKKQKIDVRVIASFHDYKKTPSLSTLNTIIQKMSLFNPTIYKIATFCKTEKQALTLLNLLLVVKEQKKDCIVLGMGKHGQITRVFGSLWGNEITFAPEKKENEVAPDQLTRQELQTIFQELERN